MSEPFSDPSFDDDLHLLVTIAVLTGQRGILGQVSTIYDAWALAYPDDALGPVGKGLSLVGEGKFKDGFSMIEAAAKNARTRVKQAEDVLKSLESSVADATA